MDSGARGCPASETGAVKVNAPSLQPMGTRLGWGASSARPTLGAALAGRGCALHNYRPGNAARAVPTGLPAQGGTPLLGRAIRITRGKILIIVASKAPPLAGAGPCPGNPNNQPPLAF